MDHGGCMLTTHTMPLQCFHQDNHANQQYVCNFRFKCLAARIAIVLTKRAHLHDFSNSEFKQGVLDSSRKHVGQISQLIKAVEALVVEIADLECGKERWLTKLKVLESKVLSNFVNFEKWGVQNMNKLQNIDGSVDGSTAFQEQRTTVFNIDRWTLREHRNSSLNIYVAGDNVTGAGTSGIAMQTVWHLSLSELISIFEGHRKKCMLSSVKKDSGLFSELHHSHEDTDMEASLPRSLIYNVPDFEAQNENLAQVGSEDMSLCGIKSLSTVKEKFSLSLAFIGGDRNTKENKDSIVDACESYDENFDLENLGKCRARDVVDGGHEVALEDEDENSSLRIENNRLQKELEKSIAKASSLEKEKNDILFAMSNAHEQIYDLENWKSRIENALNICRLTIERTKADAVALRKENIDLEKALDECKATFEMDQQAHAKVTEDLQSELINTREILDESQINISELNKVKLALELEIMNCRNSREETAAEIFNLNEMKNAVESDYNECKVMLEDTRRCAKLLEKEKDSLTSQLSDYQSAFQNIHQNYLALERDNDELQHSLFESEKKLDTTLQKMLTIEGEKQEKEETCKRLKVDFEKKEQRISMLQNENDMLENVLIKLQQTLEETQQQMMILERENDKLESEANESKLALEKALRHTLFSIEEEKAVSEMGTCECKQALEVSELQVLSLQNDLEFTLQNTADTFNHQLEQLQNEVSKSKDVIEVLQTQYSQQESRNHALVSELEELRTEIKTMRGMKEAAEDSLKNMTASAAEDVVKFKKNIQALEDEISGLKNENRSLKSSLECDAKKFTELEKEQKVLQHQLQRTELERQNTSEELNVLRSKHENEVDTLKREHAKVKGESENLVRQMEQRNLENEQKAEIESQYKELLLKLRSMEVQSQMKERELSFIKQELAEKTSDLSMVTFTKESITKQLEMRNTEIKQLEKDLVFARSEKEDLMAKFDNEMIEKNETIQTLHVAISRCRAFEDDLLAELEDEKIVRQAALEELQTIKDYVENLENDLSKVKAETCMILCRENDEKEIRLQALYKEQNKNKQLEEMMEKVNAKQQKTQMAWDSEREINESLVRELDMERQQRMKLEEQLKFLQAQENWTELALDEERKTKEIVTKRLVKQEAKCKSLEDSLNSLEIEQLNLLSLLEEDFARTEKSDKLNVDSEKEALIQLEELLERTRKLEQMLLDKMQNASTSTSALDEDKRNMVKEVKQLQSHIRCIQMGLVSNEYLGKDGEKCLLDWPEETPEHEHKIAGAEAYQSKVFDSAPNVSFNRCTEEEIKKLKENTEMFHEALFDAHHATVSEVASLLVELEALKRAMSEKNVVANVAKEQKHSFVSIPAAAISTSAVAAIGLLAFKKFPKLRLNQFS